MFNFPAHYFALQIMTEVASANCTENQESQKVRCAVDGCAKLFKGKDFLKKHLQNKHPELAFERMVRVSEKFMRDRFETWPFAFRMLPALEVESGGGKVARKSAKEVRDTAMGVAPPPRKRRQSDDHFDNSRGGRGAGGGQAHSSYGALHNPHSGFGAPRPPPPSFAPPAALADPNARTLNAYRDVDAPVAVSCVDSDVGVSLPPPKKRKLIIKKKK
jgi:hypothetical protein